MSADGSPLFLVSQLSLSGYLERLLNDMRSYNVWDTLGITINPRAVFEDFTHEAHSVTQEERAQIFARIVWAGYHVKDVVYWYLTEKSAPRGAARHRAVHETLLSVGYGLMDRVRERYQADKSDRDIADLLDFVRSHKGWQKIFKLPFELYADVLEGILSRCFSMREELLAYLGERPYYNPLLCVPIHFNELDALGERIDAIDQRLATDTIFDFWTYRGVYASWMRATRALLTPRGRKSYSLPNYIAEHTDPRMWDSPPCIHSELALAKKHFPVEDTELLQADDKLWWKRLLAYATKQAEVLWLQAPLFDDPVYVWYTNYTDKQSLHIDRLRNEGIVSICIQDFEQTGHDQGHQAYFDALVAGEKITRPARGKYIQDFLSLANKVKEQDVLIVASYKGYSDLRIGLIKKGTEFGVEQHDGYRFYYFKLKSAYCTPYWGTLCKELNPADYPILKNLSPNRGTILHVINQRRREAVYRAYYGILYPYDYRLLSDEATEEMCKIWLASDHAKVYDLHLLRSFPVHGGTTPIVDIWGLSYGETEILAQVTTSCNADLIKKKENKLLTLSKPDNKCVIFANYMFDMGKEREDWGYRISLRQVWFDLYEGTQGEKKKMQELCQIAYRQTK